MKTDTFKLNSSILWAIGGVAVVGLGFGAWYFFLKDNEVIQSMLPVKKKSKQKTGLRKSKPSTTKTKVKYEIGDDPWDMRYKDDVIAAGKRVELLDIKPAKAYALKIKNAPGWDDDEDAVYDTLKALKSWVQLSQLAGQFYRDYKKDLYNFIRAFMSDSEMKKVNRLKDGLPKY